MGWSACRGGSGGIDRLDQVGNHPEVFGAVKWAMPLTVDKALAMKIEREECENKKQCDREDPDQICWYCHVTKET